MPKKEAPIDHLQKFLPPETYEAVLQYLQFYKVHLTWRLKEKAYWVITVIVRIFPITALA
jgi:hypothetical protein